MVKKKVNRITNVLDFAPFSDNDNDNAMNLLDCEPENPKEQGAIYDWVKGKITPIYHKVVAPTISRHVQPVISRVQEVVAPYKPTISYQRAATRRATVKRKALDVVRKRIPERKEVVKFAIKTPLIRIPGQTGLLLGTKIITPVLRKKLPDMKRQIVSAGKRIIVSEIRKSPGFIATQVMQKHVFPHVKKGYDIGTGEYIAQESAALSSAQKARIAQGNVTAQQLGFTSEDILRTRLENVTTQSQQSAVTRYYSDQKKVSDAYTPRVEAYYDRVAAYNKLVNPTQAQYDKLIDSKTSSTVLFESKLSEFEKLYPSKPISVVRYEEATKPFFTAAGELKPSVLTYIAKGETEYSAFKAYEKKESETKEKWAPKYTGFVPFTLPTMEWGKKVSKPLVKGVEKVIPEKYETRGYTGVGAAKYTSLFFAGLPEWAGTVPPSAELIARKPHTALTSVPLGLGLMAGGMAKLFKEKPYAGVGTVAGMIAFPYVAKKAPIRYTGAMKLPTGKPILKTSFTWGGKLPTGLTRVGKAGELVKFEQIGKTPIGKVTYQVPEVITYRGVYGARPSLSVLPWKGLKPLAGVTTKGVKMIPKPSIGAPKLDIAKFQPRTGAETAVLLPSIMRGLHPKQARLMRGVFREVELIGRQKSAIKRPIDITLIENIPKEVRPTVMRMLREEKGIVFGSAAQRTQQILRRPMEDIDLFVKNPTITAEKWVPILNKASGKRIFRHRKGGLIEVYRDGTWRHSIDLHSMSELKGRLPYGFKPRKPLKIEGIKYVTLEEQLFRKGISLTQPRGKVISPELHRMKDIADFISASRTLTSSMVISDWTRLPVYGKMKLRRAEAAGIEIKPWQRYAYEHPKMGVPRRLEEFYPDIMGRTTLFRAKGEKYAMEEILAWKYADSGLGFLGKLKGIKIPRKVKKPTPKKVEKPTEISTVVEDILKTPTVKPKIIGKPKPTKIPPKVSKVTKKRDYFPQREVYGMGYKFPPLQHYGIKTIPSTYPKAKYIPKVPKRGYKPSILKAHVIPEYYFPFGYKLKEKKYPVGKYPPPTPPYVPHYVFKPYKPPLYEPPYVPTPTYKPPVTPPYVPPHRPPVTPPFIPPFLRIPPPVIGPPIRIKREEEIKPRRGLPWGAYQRTVKNPILQADELLKRML